MSTNQQNIAPRPEDGAAEQTDQTPVVTPPVDIFESAQEILLFADLPGASKEDVGLHVEKDRLTLEARTPTIRYKREFIVSSGVDVERTQAKVSQGVLEVHLPKVKGLATRTVKVLGA
jgi:HSP20 family molecular chaperone IbpA